VTYRESCSEECPCCGSEVLVGDRYCSRCGEPLVSDARDRRRWEPEPVLDAIGREFLLVLLLAALVIAVSLLA
jgi:predicted amidophosphoribosyltransferase